MQRNRRPSPSTRALSCRVRRRRSLVRAIVNQLEAIAAADNNRLVVGAAPDDFAVVRQVVRHGVLEVDDWAAVHREPDNFCSLNAIILITRLGLNSVSISRVSVHVFILAGEVG